MKKIILTLLLAWLLVANMNSQGVLAVTLDFQWLGNQGYTAKGSFSYDEKTAPTIFSEKSSGKMRVLENFQVSFYDNSGQEIAKIPKPVKFLARSIWGVKGWGKSIFKGWLTIIWHSCGWSRQIWLWMRMIHQKLSLSFD